MAAVVVVAEGVVGSGAAAEVVGREWAAVVSAAVAALAAAVAWRARLPPSAVRHLSAVQPRVLQAVAGSLGAGFPVAVAASDLDQEAPVRSTDLRQELRLARGRGPSIFRDSVQALDWNPARGPPLGPALERVRESAQEQESGRDRASVNYLLDKGRVAARWLARSVAARLSCRAWEIGCLMAENGQANLAIGHRSSDATTCKTGFLVATIGLKIGRIGATTSARIGKGDTTSFTICITIGITGIGTITATGGATCGTTTRR